MPLHTTAPGQKTLVFVHPKDGKFVTEEGEFAAIEGKLDLVKIEHDAGNGKKVLPYDAFIMHISDDTTVYRIKINIERNFAFSVAAVLGDLEKGDEVLAKTKAGTDPTVTFCNFLKKDSTGNWVRPERVEMPADKNEKVAFLRKIVDTHSAKAMIKTE